MDSRRAIFTKEIERYPKFGEKFDENRKKYENRDIKAELAAVIGTITESNHIVEQVEDRPGVWAFGLEGGIGATWNFVNAKDIDVYTEGKAQNVGFSTKNFSISFTRYLYDGKYYYGYSVGIGYYTPGVELGNGFGVTPILEKIGEAK